MKRLFWLFLAPLASVLMNSATLSADNHFAVKSPAFPHVQTVEIAESQAEAPSVAETPTATFAASVTAAQPVLAEARTVAEPVVPAAPAAATPAPLNYNVTIIIPTVEEYVSKNLSYSDIYRFEKMIYGHNSSNLLGNLKTLGIGDTFTVTERGVTTLYRVAAIETYRNGANGLNDDPKMMGRVAYTAMGHDVALLTCAGTAYGNGNASHRLVVFADKV